MREKIYSNWDMIAVTLVVLVASVIITFRSPVCSPNVIEKETLDCSDRVVLHLSQIEVPEDRYTNEFFDCRTRELASYDYEWECSCEDGVVI